MAFVVTDFWKSNKVGAFCSRAAWVSIKSFNAQSRSSVHWNEDVHVMKSPIKKVFSRMKRYGFSFHRKVWLTEQRSFVGRGGSSCWGQATLRVALLPCRGVAVCVGFSVLYSCATSEAGHGVGCCLGPVTWIRKCSELFRNLERFDTVMLCLLNLIINLGLYFKSFLKFHFPS